MAIIINDLFIRLLRVAAGYVCKQDAALQCPEYQSQLLTSEKQSLSVKIEILMPPSHQKT